jgi:hypothetical protein
MQMNRRARDAELAYEATPRELSQVTRKIESVLDAIENGIFTASTRERLIELEQRKLRLERVDTINPIPRLHPAIADVYRAKVVKLQEALNEPATRGEAAEILRSLITQRHAGLVPTAARRSSRIPPTAFDLAIDSKLRNCDVVRLRGCRATRRDSSPRAGAPSEDRHPVRFEITEHP